MQALWGFSQVPLGHTPSECGCAELAQCPIPGKGSGAGALQAMVPPGWESMGPVEVGSAEGTSGQPQGLPEQGYAKAALSQSSWISEDHRTSQRIWTSSG